MAWDIAPATSDMRLLNEATEALRHASVDTVRLVLAALRAGNDRDERLDPAFGPSRSTQEYTDALTWHAGESVRRRSEVIARSIRRGDAARRLRVTPQAVSDMLERGALLGLKEGREWRIPLWQFDDESESGVLDGLSEVFDHFPGSVVALSQWMAGANVDLDDATPAEALRRGERERVVQLVDAL